MILFHIWIINDIEPLSLVSIWLSELHSFSFNAAGLNLATVLVSLHWIAVKKFR